MVAGGIRNSRPGRDDESGRWHQWPSRMRNGGGERGQASLESASAIPRIFPGNSGDENSPDCIARWVGVTVGVAKGDFSEPRLSLSPSPSTPHRFPLVRNWGNIAWFLQSIDIDPME